MRGSLLAFIVCLLPWPALGAVQITEVMYDVSGTDTGREWFEFTNTGDSSIDVSGYKFFEANTNHALAAVSGSGVVQPGGSAIVADDSAKFLLDYPSFSGTLFDSSFSLSNTGETIVLKDGALTVLDTVIYDAGSGGAGDGNSLQRAGATFAAAAPNPGSYTESSESGAASDSSVSATNSAQTTPSQNGMAPPSITTRIKTDSLTMVGGGSFFSAEAYGTQGLPLSGARFIWNFGDGATLEGARVFHAYSYPGKYAVLLTAAHNYSSSVDRVIVEAVAAQVVLQSEGDGSLLIKNLSKSDVDVGMWSLSDGGKSFVIPEDTFVLANEGVRFARSVTQLEGSAAATLRYPNNAVAASATAGANSPLRGERVTSEATSGRSAPASAAVSASAQADSEVLGSADEKGASGYPIFSWPLVALVALLGTGAGSVYYLQKLPAFAKETPLSADEFEIE